MAASTSLRLTAMVPRKLLTNVSLHGGVETPRHYYCFWLCNTSTNALFSYITYMNSVFAVLYAETSILFFSRTNSHLLRLKTTAQTRPFQRSNNATLSARARQAILSQGGGRCRDETLCLRLNRNKLASVL